MSKEIKKLFHFNIPETHNTIATFDLSDLENKVNESRKKFGK